MSKLCVILKKMLSLPPPSSLLKFVIIEKEKYDIMLPR